MNYFAITTGYLVCCVLAVSGFSKIHDRSAFVRFRASLRSFRLVPGNLLTPVAVAVVAIELAVPVLVALPIGTRRAGLGLGAALMAALTAAVWSVVARRISTPCRCFGSSTAPLSRRHIVRNALLALAASVGLLAPSGSTHPAGAVLAAGVGLILALVMIRLDDLIDLFTSSAPRPV